MKTATKLPYKVQFQPEYEHFQERIGKLPVPPIGPNSIIQSIQQIVDLHGIKQRIKDEQLQFTPSNIYFQYATPNQLKQGAKKINQLCPGCGQQNKKPIQCQFCAVMYCKNCCWRKRVIPTLSQPKDYRLQCQDCHNKFVRLFANQKFYSQSAIFQKIIESCSGRVKKLEQNLKSKKQKFQLGQKKKKQAKIKQNMILKQLKDEQKKVQALQQKLQQVVKNKAEQIKKIHQQQQKKQEQEIERKKREKQIEQTLQRQKELQIQQQKMKKKEQQIQLQLKQKEKEIQEQKKQQQIRQQLKKTQQEKNLQQSKKLQQSKLKRQISDIKHIQQTNELVNLAKGMLQEPQHLDQIQIKNTPQIIVTSAHIENLQKSQKQKQKQIQKKEKDDIFVTPNENLFKADSSTQLKINMIMKQQLPSKKNNTQINQILPLKSLTNVNKSSSSQKNQKAQLTESTQKAAQSHDQIENTQKITEQVNKNQKQVQDNLFSSLPEIAINVTQMTVNQLLGIHINPHTNQNQNLAKRQSQRDSYVKQQKTTAELVLQQKPVYEQPSPNELTQQQKYEILRQSNITSSILHSKHDTQQLYEHHDPTGSKCNCMLM